MTPAQIALLNTDENGLPIIRVMSDPGMIKPDGTPGGFVSLVDAGANQRRIAALKSAGGEAAQPPAPSRYGARLLSSLGLAWLLPQAAEKSAESPTTFSASIAMPLFREHWWAAKSAISTAIRNILADPAILDKTAAVSTELDAFKAHVVAMVAQITAAPQFTAKHATELGQFLASDAGATLWPAEPATSREAAEKAAGGGVHVPSGEPASTLGETMNLLLISQLAAAASETAIKTATAAGITDPVQKAARGDAAAAHVFKSVAGMAPDAALPTGTLAEQIARISAGGSQLQQFAALTNPGDAAFNAMGGMAGFQQLAVKLNALVPTLEKIPAMVETVEKLSATVNGAGEGDKAEPGIMQIVTDLAAGLDAVAKHLKPDASEELANKSLTEVNGRKITAAKIPNAFNLASPTG